MDDGLQNLIYLALIAATIFIVPLLLLWCPLITIFLAFSAIIAVGIAPSKDYLDFELATGLLY
jgi:hypothetical protein